MQNRITAFIKKEAVLCIAGLLAILSCFLVPPSRDYLGYINFSTLAMLFSLMSVVAGMRAIGVFDVMSRRLLQHAKGLTGVTLVLVLLCFFMSMFLTNDVTLVTIVPFTILVFAGMGMSEHMILPLTMETIAANLGSMMLPFGNPQNLFLYSYYDYSMGEFIRLMLPYTAVSLILVILCTLVGCRMMKTGSSASGQTTGGADANAIPEIRSKKALMLYLALFLVSIASVAHLIDWRLAFLIVFAVILIMDRKLFTKVDYSLLVTFVFFFIFIGNLGNISAVQGGLASILSGREVPVAIVTSQFASNVPAAILLSGFTDRGAGLLIGTNLGGLGTLIASMASLITYKFFAEAQPRQTGRYLTVFSILNVGLLIILYGFHMIIQ